MAFSRPLTSSAFPCLAFATLRRLSLGIGLLAALDERQHDAVQRVLEVEVLAGLQRLPERDLVLDLSVPLAALLELILLSLSSTSKEFLVPADMSCMERVHVLVMSLAWLDATFTTSTACDECLYRS